MLSLQGNTEAWFHLGVMHLNGWGVPRNVMQAQYFFSMTAKTVRHPLRQKAHLKHMQGMHVFAHYKETPCNTC